MHIMKQQESGQRRIPRHRRSKALPLALPLADPPELLSDPLALLAGLAVAEVEEKQKGKVNQFLRY